MVRKKKDKVETVPTKKEIEQVFLKNLKKKSSKKNKTLKFETMKIVSEREIAFDFATKVYKNFDKMIKSVILFGSSTKETATPSSDIDIIIIIDDVSIKFDNELIGWYRDDLAKIIQKNSYRKSLHINTVKLSTWWQDLMRGDPIVVNVLRYGDALIDFGGFFNPLKILLMEGKIKSTPESIYTLLQRAPTHTLRARQSLLAAIDGLYWAMVDSAHAALIASNVMPASPEHIPEILTETFVNKKMLDRKYVIYYAQMHDLAKDIIHGRANIVFGKDIDNWIKKTDDFVDKMVSIVDKLIR